jgi:hypothetical protein
VVLTGRIPLGASGGIVWFGAARSQEDGTNSTKNIHNCPAISALCHHSYATKEQLRKNYSPTGTVRPYTSIIRGMAHRHDPLLNSTGVPVRTSSRDDRRIRSGAFFWRPTKARSRLQGVHVVRFSIVAVSGTTGRCQQVNFRVLHLLPKSRGSVFSQQMNSIRPPV